MTNMYKIKTTQSPFSSGTLSTWSPSSTISSSMTMEERNDHFRSNITTRSILIGLDVFNCIFQVMCCYLLVVILIKSQQKKSQQIYILNLAISELFASLFLTARDVINLMRLYPENVRLGQIDRTFWIMNMFFVTAVKYIYISAWSTLHATDVYILDFLSDISRIGVSVNRGDWWLEPG